MSCRHKQKDRHEIVINKRETEREGERKDF